MNNTPIKKPPVSLNFTFFGKVGEVLNKVSAYFKRVFDVLRGLDDTEISSLCKTVDKENIGILKSSDILIIHIDCPPELVKNLNS